MALNDKLYYIVYDLCLFVRIKKPRYNLSATNEFLRGVLEKLCNVLLAHLRLCNYSQ
jgi:hypothetical protein